MESAHRRFLSSSFDEFIDPNGIIDLPSNTDEDSTHENRIFNIIK